MKKVLLLGSSGSIGVNTLNVIQHLPEEFEVSGLAVYSNITKLFEQISIHKPKAVIIVNKKAAEKFKSDYNYDGKVYIGNDGLLEASANLDYDIFVGAMVGFPGLPPAVEAIKRGKRIALANKETLVAAGEIIMPLCRKHSADLIPIDSEHSAIFQCLTGEKFDQIEKIILTASGGPFRNHSIDELKMVTIADALNHPNWKMGNKITIDSASMMNKGLEVIEAYWLFNLSKEQVEVVIHPQSIIHSMVQFVDGSIKAQLGLPDMRLPIQYALTFPDRLKNDFDRANMPLIKNLTFFEPDFNKFECLKHAFDVLETGGTSGCILNAANEVAVSKFLNNEINFTDIPVLIKKALDNFEVTHNPCLESILECDNLTRRYVTELN